MTPRARSRLLASSHACRSNHRSRQLSPSRRRRPHRFAIQWLWRLCAQWVVQMLPIRWSIWKRVDLRGALPFCREVRCLTQSPAERRAARKLILATELAAKLTPSMYEHLLKHDGLLQLRRREDRANAISRVLLSLGGPDGDGLQAASKALDTLAAASRRET